MRRYLRMAAAWGLALCLTLSLLPGSALAGQAPGAAEEPGTEETVPGEIGTEEETVPEDPEEESVPGDPEEESVPGEPEEETVPGESEEETVPEEPGTEETAPPEESAGEAETGAGLSGEENPESFEGFIEAPLLEVVDGTEQMMSGIMLLDAGDWNGNSYGESLTGLAKTAYDHLAAAFVNNTIQYGEMPGISGAPYGAYYREDWRTVTLSENTAAAANAAAAPYRADIDKAYTAFLYDHPEYFWIRNHGLGTMAWINTDPSRNEFTLVISISFTMHTEFQAASVRNNYQTRVNTQVDKILQNSRGMSTVARLAYFDYWLCANNGYNRKAGDSTYTGYTKDFINTDQKPWNVLSAFLEEYSPVCEGYAKGFQLLCHKIGVPCVTVSSSGHMWNAVKVEGEWYYVDCTWNDPTPYDNTSLASNNYSNRNYFLIHAFNDSSHGVAQSLQPPVMAGQNYFDTVWYTDVNGTSSGGGNNYLMAVYNGDHKMLDIQNCDSFYWKPDTNRVIGPGFSASVLNAAQSGKVFSLDDDWKPMKSVDTVSNLKA